MSTETIYAALRRLMQDGLTATEATERALAEVDRDALVAQVRPIVLITAHRIARDVARKVEQDARLRSKRLAEAEEARKRWKAGEAERAEAFERATEATAKRNQETAAARRKFAAAEEKRHGARAKRLGYVSAAEMRADIRSGNLTPQRIIDQEVDALTAPFKQAKAFTDAFLASTFALADGTHVSWGEALVEHHADRVTTQQKHIAGVQDDIDLHMQIIDILQASGLATLAEVCEKAKAQAA